MSPRNELNRAMAWHARPADDAIDALETRFDGLTADEAAARRAAHGPNSLRPPQTRGPLLRLLAQFHNVLIYVLLGAGVVTAALQQWIDAAVIFGVVVINAVVGFVQEGKAERALDAIRDMLSPTATLIRDGRRVVLPAEEIVPGDVVLLQSGDKVPADLRLIRAKGLQIQEAVLTGESLPVEKATAPVDEHAALGDRSSMAYSGTLVSRGQARGIAVATGDRTEIGQISTLLGGVEVLTTPLLRQVAVFSRWLTVAILLLAVVTFVFGLVARDYPAAQMFLAAVALAVAAIPEGLPAVMTITLALGVQRMARRNAIVRRLPAVETLGSVSLICSDKTGTLTRNEMTVRSIATYHHLFAVTGVGYAPTGGFLLDDVEVSIEDHPLLRTMAQGAFLCSDAVIREVDGAWTVEGDPTEGALVTAALKAGLDPDFETRAWPRTDVIPFESEHRFMATLHHDHEGNAVMYVKGAPERILAMCDRQRTREGYEPLDASYWTAQVAKISAGGQRVLALAARHTASDHSELHFDDVGQGLVMIGLFGLLDPPREEAIAAVSRCQSAGIRVKMITGDHGETARAIAGQIGLVNAADVLTGQQIDALDEDALRARATVVDVFARTSPEHKLRLVQSLQLGGQVVAMTGDGVNDAPALKRADVGVAMGMKGTEAAKEAAEMVLADDNFATIAQAVEEGRTVYDNLKKSITFILPTNGGEALIVVAAILLGSTLPLTPVQILWVNMITAVTLALALAFEPPESDVMRRAPRPPKEPILSGFLVWRVSFVSALLLLGTFGLFLWELGQGAGIELARTVAVNALVMLEVAYLFNTRHLRDPVISRAGLFGSRPVLISIGIVITLQLLFTYAPPMQVLFDTRPVSLLTWGVIVLVAVAALLVVEAEKWLFRNRSG